LYGGFGASAAEVWEWNGTNWTSLLPTNGPSVTPFTSYSQDNASLDFDTALGTIFAGPTTDGFYDIYYWTWDGRDWHSRAVGFEYFNYYTPAYGQMVYDTYRYRALHYGGQDNGIGFTGSSTTAYYDSSSDSWSLLPDAGQTSAF